ncbi:alpha/beta fold hydrolase [Chloroflexus aggregans]|uniref:Alpha/beta hydrolase fold protein n=1 Tax=Chloroflexus aggregans (strain MD-66 / DSM 9485) TaxID=326427 RepID=B8G7N0_CHLAD|nr:alpha/beta hydrolase [Chloroflexus aggregans]ACL26065.1 alpha/beta hydrolase fold protein [Chloroflexus aggregans DSM 9485]
MSTSPTIWEIESPVGPIAFRVSGQGRPLILVHGWGGSSRYWLAAPAFLPNRRLIAIDLPGCGASPAPLEPVTLDSYVNAIVAVADELGLDRFALAGHSLGAAVALAVAGQVGERVERLILVSFGFGANVYEDSLVTVAGAQWQVAAAYWRPWLVWWRPWWSATQQWREAWWTLPPTPELLARPMVYRPLDRSLLAQGIADLIAMDPLVAIESAAIMGHPQLKRAVRRPLPPMLLISGQHDPVFPPINVRAFNRYVPEAQVVLLPDCGHVPMVEEPATCYHTIARFLDGENDYLS